MSVQQENTTAALRPCATTLLVHITALANIHVRMDMLETDETVHQARSHTYCPSMSLILYDLRIILSARVGYDMLS